MFYTAYWAVVVSWLGAGLAARMYYSWVTADIKEWVLDEEADKLNWRKK